MPHTGRVLQCDPATFAGLLNVRPYELAHTLKDHPLLQMPVLIDLAERLVQPDAAKTGGAHLSFDQGVVESRELREGHSRHRRDYAPRLLRFIDQADATIAIQHLEREDGYRQIMEAIVLDALSLSGDTSGALLRSVASFEAILLISSPGRVTEYHLDDHCSWIFQVRGTKALHVFDRADKEVVPDQELERFHAGDRCAARYKPEYQTRAATTELRPGTGAHVPVNAPHWLQGGDDVSISLNIVFHFREGVHASLYRANNLLRRAGLSPSTPGARPRADRLKAAAAQTAGRLARRLTSKVKHVPEEAAEEKRRIEAIMAASQGS